MKKYIVQIILVLFVIFSYSQRNPGEYDIKILQSNSKKSDFGPAFYGKNKIIFASSRNRSGKKWEGNNQSFLDLYECEILGNGKIKNLQKLYSNINLQYHESSVSFSPDGKTVYFTRNNNYDGEEEFELDSITSKKKKRRPRKKRERKPSQNKKQMTFLAIYRADVVGEKWTNITYLPFNNQNYSVGHPSVNKNGTKLYFASSASGFGMSDIFVVDILSDGIYGAPKNLGKKINTYGRDNFPFIDDNDILYFSSDGRSNTIGGLDIYAVKIYKDGSVSDLLHLPSPINTIFDDFSYIINNDNQEGYFSSNREEGAIGDDDIYHFNATIPLSFDCEQQVSGVILDKKTSKVLPNTSITITSNNEMVKTIKSDFQGQFKVSLACDSNFKFYATKKEYDGAEKNIKTTGDYKKIIKTEMRLKPIVCNQNFDGIVYNAKDNSPIDGALVTIYDVNGKRVTNTKTDSRGKFNVLLKCNSKFKITAVKDEFEREDKLVVSTKMDGDSHKVTLNLKPILCNKTISGFVYSEDDNLPLADAVVTIENENGEVITTTNSKKDGSYDVMLDCKKKYKIIVRKDKFEKEDTSFHIKKIDVTFDFTLKTKIEEVVKVGEKIVVNINPIYFELDRANITRTASVELDKVVLIMKKYPNLKIEAGSHTDSRGPKTYNEKLSSRRASSTVNYIVKQGIDTLRITSKGYGESQPTNRCVDGVKCDNDEYQQNRRTEFVILNPEVLNLKD